MRIHEGVVYVDGEPVAAGQVLDAELVAAQMAEARDGMAAHLTSFTHNTSEFLRREQDLLLHGRGLPGTRTSLAGRPAVVVVAGHEHRAQLAGARRYVREARPVLIGVDRGADALLDAGHTPDVVVIGTDVADGDRASARALKSARDVVVRVESGGSRGRHREPAPARACTRSCWRPAPPPRTPPSCSPTAAARASSSAWGCTRRSRSSSTASAPAWPAPS